MSVLTPVLYRCNGFTTWRPTICCTKKTYGYFIKHVKATKNTVSKKAQYEKENPLSLVVAKENTQFVVYHGYSCFHKQDTDEGGRAAAAGVRVEHEIGYAIVLLEQCFSHATSGSVKSRPDHES